MILQREENNRKLEHHLINNLMKYAGQDKFTLKSQNIPTSFPCSVAITSTSYFRKPNLHI